MVIKCLDCNHKCGAPFNLAFHYSICREDKIGKCACGDKTLSGICMKTDGFFKDEFGYSPNIDSSSNPSSSPNPSPNPSPNHSPNPCPSSSSSSNPSIDPSPNPKLITRCFN